MVVEGKVVGCQKTYCFVAHKQNSVRLNQKKERAMHPGKHVPVRDFPHFTDFASECVTE